MTYETLIHDACDEFEEFRNAYNNALANNDIDVDSGNHTVFSVVFLPLLCDAINKGSTNTEKYFDFMEKMETCGDPRVAEVCEFTVLEELCDEYDNKTMLNLLQKTRETLQAYNCIRNYVQN